MGALLLPGRQDGERLDGQIDKHRRELAHAAWDELRRSHLRGKNKGQFGARRLLIARAALHYFDVVRELPTANGHEDETPFTIVAETLLEAVGVRTSPFTVRDDLESWRGPHDGDASAFSPAIREALNSMADEVQLP